MKILSLFDGMSVAQQALKEAGIPVESYYASEIDEYAIAVTQSNFPNTRQVGDVSKVQGCWNVPCLGEVDLMIGGSPCQDLSIAKKGREGLSGSRSGLFWEYVRIRNEVKPKYFILENVASMPKEAKEVISEALGVQPVMINASLVSAQNRKRLFWVGKWNGERYEQVEIEQPDDRGILLKDILESDVDEKYFELPKNIVRRTSMNMQWDTSGKGYNSQQDRASHISGKSKTLPSSRTEDKCKIFYEVNGAAIRGQIGKPRAIEIRKDDKSNTITTGQTKESLVAVFSNYNNTLNYDKANTLGSNSQCQTAKTGQGLVDFEKQIIRKLTPTECLRLQSMPDDYFDKAEYKGKPISNTQRYKMCGNAFNKEVIVHILKNLK